MTLEVFPTLSILWFYDFILTLFWHLIGINLGRAPCKMQSFHQNLRYIQVILTFRKLDQVFSNEMSIFIKFFILFRSLAPCSISLRRLDGSVRKKKTLKKVPCKKYFQTYFTNLHSFFNTTESANLRLELFSFHPYTKIMKNINAAVEVRERRKIQESLLKYPSM